MCETKIREKIMNKIFFSAALLATTLVHAATPIEGWYGSAFGGYAYIPNNLNYYSPGSVWSKSSYKAGFDVGGNFGFKSTPLRYEGELTYISASLNGFNLNRVEQTGIQGFNHVGLAMANVYYDFPALIPTIEPFLGVGVGYGYVDSEFKSTGPLGMNRYDPENNVFAYQATGGLTYNFAETYALNIGYRYVATENVGNFGKMFQSHLANVGAIYRFDGNNYK